MKSARRLTAHDRLALWFLLLCCVLSAAGGWLLHGLVR